jgi:hypothetical protein
VERGDVLSDDACGSLFYPVGPQGDWMGLRISARSHYCSSGGSWAVERAGLGPWFVMLLSWFQSRSYRREGKIVPGDQYNFHVVEVQSKGRQEQLE